MGSVCLTPKMLDDGCEVKVSDTLYNTVKILQISVRIEETNSVSLHAFFSRNMVKNFLVPTIET